MVVACLSGECWSLVCDYELFISSETGELEPYPLFGRVETLNWYDGIMLGGLTLTVIAAASAFIAGFIATGVAFATVSIILGFGETFVREWPDLKSVQEVCKHLTEQNNIYSRQNVQHQQNNQVQQAQIDQLTQQVTSLNLTKDQLEQTKNELEETKDELSEETSRLSGEVDRLHDMIENSGEELYRNLRESRELQEENSKARADLKDLSDQLSDIKTEYEAVKDKLAEENEKLEKQNKRYEELNAIHEQNLQALKDFFASRAQTPGNPDDSPEDAMPSQESASEAEDCND